LRHIYVMAFINFDYGYNMKVTLRLMNWYMIWSTIVFNSVKCRWQWVIGMRRQGYAKYMLCAMSVECYTQTIKASMICPQTICSLDNWRDNLQISSSRSIRLNFINTWCITFRSILPLDSSIQYVGLSGATNYGKHSLMFQRWELLSNGRQYENMVISFCMSQAISEIRHYW